MVKKIWEDIQMDWANEAEKKHVAGILLWDLSAAFDTLDKDIENSSNLKF